MRGEIEVFKWFGGNSSRKRVRERRALEGGSNSDSLAHLIPIWSLLLIHKHLLWCALFLSLSLFQLVLCPLVRDQIVIPHLPAFLLLLFLWYCSIPNTKGVPPERIHGINMGNAEYSTLPPRDSQSILALSALLDHQDHACGVHCT